MANFPPSKPSLIKTWAVFGAAAILLILISVVGEDGNVAKLAAWNQRTTWFLSLLFGALGVTFAIQLVHCTALSSFWPSLAISFVVCVMAALAFANVLTWGAALGLALIGLGVLGYKAFAHMPGRNSE